MIQLNLRIQMLIETIVISSNVLSEGVSFVVNGWIMLRGSHIMVLFKSPTLLHKQVNLVLVHSLLQIFH